MKKIKMLVSILTEKPIFSKVSRGGFFGITLFDQEFLGVYFSTFSSFDGMKLCKYRQVYIGGYFCFYGLGISLSWDIEGSSSDW